MSEKIIRNGDAELFTQTHGDPAHPPILLIMGAMASMLWWPDSFCEGLAEAGYFVIRYDNRDTGLSTQYPPGNPGYTMSDMASDAMAIMDGYNINRTHVIGMSLGGMIAQRLALAHPQRIRSLTLISTTPIGIDGLPSMTEDYLTHSASAETLDWTDKASVLDFMLRDAAVIASTKHPHDTEATKQFVKRDMNRARNFASATNHFVVAGGPPAGTAAELKVPVLAIHGTSDPIFPLAHGEAFTTVVKDVELLRIDGGGHEIHQNDIPTMVKKISSFAERVV